MATSDEAIMIGGQPLSDVLHGAEYQVTRLSGWWERPAVKRTALARPAADGDFPSPWHFEARKIAIDGLVQAADHGQMHHIMDQLSALCTLSREWLSIQGHGPTTSALVEADEAPFFHPVTDTLMRFELRFKANDPRRYGVLREEELTSIYKSLFQWGTYPAPVQVEAQFFAAWEGFRITGVNEGGTHIWDYEDQATSQQEHLADIGAGMHFVDGDPTPERMGRMQTWSVMPRASTSARIQVLDSGEIASAVLRYRDTYI